MSETPAAYLSAQTLTVLVPVFNEEESLLQFVVEMNKFLVQTPLPTTVLFINDGSTDGSLELLRSICGDDRRYEFISLAHNQGLSTAIKAGIDHCRSTLVGYIDSDIQTTPLDFLKFLEFFPEYDMVNGIRAKRQDTMVKKLSSKLANTVRRTLINDGIQDTGCPLKILKIEYARRLPLFHGMHRFLGALVQLQGAGSSSCPCSISRALPARPSIRSGTGRGSPWSTPLGSAGSAAAGRTTKSGRPCGPNPARLMLSNRALV
ncbi:glycosyltransferase [Hymenobacter cellulosilyticus]|uniref:Glycosyltransferase n=1 Tax=Hymenobacter cellulosilyticus TaxID=2932248 RepID=A0A8T9Q0H9_9BACT|nr:glycosyltransferase [Hymenobacter cellulosilyticus]UOQ70877.1 glycosyltransferase [Hymenobacter cellulosilyticus]